MSHCKQIIRTPSQLYRFKPSHTHYKNGPQSSDACIIGPEFVVRSKESPLKINLLKNDAKKNSLKKVTVVKLSGQRIEITCCPSTACVSHLFEAMCKEEEACLFPFLGVAKLIHGEFYFLPPSIKLFKVAPQGWRNHTESRHGISFNNFTLYLRFISYPNFYPGVPHEKTLMRQLYLQLRRDLIDGRLFLSSPTLLLLAAFSLHAEFGQEPLMKGGDYFLLEHFLPQYFLQSSRRSSAEIYKNLRSLHSSLSVRGFSREIAKCRFVVDAYKIHHLGTHFYRVISDLGKSVWLAGSSQGLHVLQEAPSLAALEKGILYPWDYVKKMSRHSRRLVLQFKTEGGDLRKMYFTFRQSEGCDFVLYVLKVLYSRRRPCLAEAEATPSEPVEYAELRAAVEAVALNPVSHCDKRSSPEPPPTPPLVASPILASSGIGDREEHPIEMEDYSRKDDSSSSHANKSYRFRRRRAYRNWWKRNIISTAVCRTPSPAGPSSSSPTVARTPSPTGVTTPSPSFSGRSSPSYLSTGISEAGSLCPLMSPLSMDATKRLKRLVDQSFSPCQSPSSPLPPEGIISVSVPGPVETSRPELLPEIPGSLVVPTGINAHHNPSSKSTTLITVTAGPPPRSPVSATRITVHHSESRNAPVPDKELASRTLPQETVSTNRTLRRGSETFCVAPLNSGTSLSLSPSFGSQKGSPSRLTCLGVRMGTRVPNALLNKHKFLGVESPPATPSKVIIPWPPAPVVIEPEVAPALDPDETVNASLLGRFLEAPTVAGTAERRLATVNLRRKRGSLGLVLALGCDKAIYVKGVTPGGSAEQLNVLKPGDRLVGVNGLCVDSLSYGQTIDVLRQAPDEVSLLVSQPIRPLVQSPTFPVCDPPSEPPSFKEEDVPASKGNYVTVISITPETEQISGPKVVAKRLQFLSHGEV